MEELELWGDVLIEGRVVLEDVLFSVTVAQGSAQGLGGWTGTFDVPEDDYEAQIALNGRQEFTAKFEDGRTGQFTITRKPMMQNRTAHIEGTANIV